MPTFAYEALNAAGKPQKGTIDAASSEEAIQRIKGQQLFPTSVRPAKGKGSKKDKNAQQGDPNDLLSMGGDTRPRW